MSASIPVGGLWAAVMVLVLCSTSPVLTAGDSEQVIVTPTGRALSESDKAYQAVAEEVKANPQKVLAIVEDHMIAHQGSACEIVRAAIRTSHANAHLRNQIISTAVNLAPNMSQAIHDCTVGFGGESSKTVQDVQPLENSKTVRDVQPAAAVSEQAALFGEAAGGAPSADDAFPSDIRGIYFITPMSGAVVAGNTTQITTKATTKATMEATTEVISVKVVSSRAPNHSTPLSPSTGLR